MLTIKKCVLLSSVLLGFMGSSVFMRKQVIRITIKASEHLPVAVMLVSCLVRIFTLPCAPRLPPATPSSEHLPATRR